MKRILTSALVAALLPLSALAGNYTFSQNTGVFTTTTGIAHGQAVTWGLNGTSYTNLFNDVNSGQTVTAATLTLTNIRDWTGEGTDPADALFVNILSGLDSTAVKTKTFDTTTYDSDLWSRVRNPFLDDTVNTGTADWNQVLQGTSTGPALLFNDAVTGSLLKSTDADQAWTAYQGAVPASVTWSDRTGNVASTVVITFTAANLSVLRTLIDADSGSGSPNVGLGFAAECHYYMTGVTLNVTTSGPPSVPDSGSTIALMGLGMAAMIGFRRFKK